MDFRAFMDQYFWGGRVAGSSGPLGGVQYTHPRGTRLGFLMQWARCELDPTAVGWRWRPPSASMATLGSSAQLNTVISWRTHKHTHTHTHTHRPNYIMFPIITYFRDCNYFAFYLDILLHFKVFARVGRAWTPAINLHQ